MKYYKTEFDMNAPTKCRVAMLANSDYGLAVGLKKNGNKVDLDASEVTLKIGSETISADSTDNGMAVFSLSSGFDGGSVLAHVDFDRPGQVLNYYDEKTESAPGGRQRNIQYKAELSAMTDTQLVGLKPSQIKLFGKHWKDGDAEPAELNEQEIVYVTIDGTNWTRHTDQQLWRNGDLSAETIDVPLSATITAPLGQISKKTYVVTKIDIDQQPIDATFKLELAAEDRGAYFKKDGSGGDVPADVATKTWVNSQISDFVDEDALTAYYTKSETSSATELAGALANVNSTATSALTAANSAKGWVDNYAIDGHNSLGYSESAPGVLAIETVYESEWTEISADAGEEPNVMVIVLPDQA